MSIDFLKIVNEVHPSLGDPKSGPSRSISNDTLAKLTGVIHSLKQDKQERLLKVDSQALPLIYLHYVIFGSQMISLLIHNTIRVYLSSYFNPPHPPRTVASSSWKEVDGAMESHGCTF